MKISKLFHWLYAAIMFLPLVVLPVFAIYSHRHTLTEQTNVDVQYKYESNEVNSLNDIVADNIYFIDKLTFDSDSVGDFDFDLYFIFIDSADYNFSVINFDGFDFDADVNTSLNIYSESTSTLNFYSWNLDTNSQLSINTNITSDKYYTVYNAVFYTPDTATFYIWWDNCFPDKLPQYTDYNIIESVTVEDTNSDIMSVCVEQFNNSINKYFNMRRVFNLNDLYTWLNTNVFNNANSIGFNICFNLFAYWLFVSLLWLLFDAFMYIPLIMHNAIDKARLE